MTVTLQEIASRTDHTLLGPDSSRRQLEQLCKEGVRFSTASVCVPPNYVKYASDYTEGKLKTGTVIGFPNGYQTARTKVFETGDAIENGADEIDMVIAVDLLKSGDYAAVEQEIRAVKAVCESYRDAAKGNKILKVIIETCLLTQAEKIRMCEIVSDSGADYIKTSTGFGGGGATVADVMLMKKHIAPHVSIKASGGISSLADAEKLILAGAGRLGTSRIIKLIGQAEATSPEQTPAY